MCFDGFGRVTRLLMMVSLNSFMPVIWEANVIFV